VKLSVKSDYAVRAVLELARHYGAGGVRRVEELAQQQAIPPNYLVQILLELKANQIVRSLRGKDGGYLLARPPAEITMGDILRAIHGKVFESPAQSDPKCPAELQAAWTKLQTTLDQAADSIHFQYLVEQSSDKANDYYI
jgi:Rrf2 family cysteine metabolism transcriptional repressor